MTSDGLAECDWIRGVLESACDRVHDLTLHRRRSINLPNEPTANVMKADSDLNHRRVAIVAVQPKNFASFARACRPSVP